MRIPAFCTAVIGLLIATGVGAAAATSAAAQSITIIREDWQDAKRDRTVPVKIYLPAGAGPFPVVIHSHGLGGTREASSVILTPLAETGFVVVTLQHPGSDISIRTPAVMAEMAAGRVPVSGETAVKRYGDALFAMRELARRNAAEGPLKGKLNMQKIGMSGHSFGALGTLVALGESVPMAPPGAFRVPGLAAGIVYSPNKPRREPAQTAFKAIKVPVLHFTGTEDRTPMDAEATPWERTIPFQNISGSDQFLLVVNGGDHQLFSGRRTAEGRAKPGDAVPLQTITDETIRFWRAYLKDDKKAATELCALPARDAGVGAAYVKAARCGTPTPIRPAP